MPRIFATIWFLDIDFRRKRNREHHPFPLKEMKEETRTIIEDKFHALILEMEHAIFIANTLTEMLGRLLKLETYVDSRSVYFADEVPRSPETSPRYC